jgi:amino acid transporter
MIYGIVCLTLILLRKKKPEQKNFFRIKYGEWLGYAGILITVWLLSNSRITELRDIGIALAAGLLIFYSVKFSATRK